MAKNELSGFDEVLLAPFEHPQTFAPQPITERVKISDGGRLVIPAAMRAAMGIEAGDIVTVRLYPTGELRVISRSAAIAKAQTVVRKYVSADISLVDELIAERRAEAERE
jgi:AbrB family looped-hinge helix DNA binding protein